jgi:hypothetical protein
MHYGYDLWGKIQGIGDFDENGRADVLWRHKSGQVGIWLMDGGRFVADVYPQKVANGWRIQGLVRDARWVGGCAGGSLRAKDG